VGYFPVIFAQSQQKQQNHLKKNYNELVDKATDELNKEFKKYKESLDCLQNLLDYPIPDGERTYSECNL